MPQGWWSIQLTDNIFFSHPCYSADISTERCVSKLQVLNPERVDLYILLSNLTGSVELEKCRQTLCRVGNSSNIPNDILLDVKNSYVLSTLFKEMVLTTWLLTKSISGSLLLYNTHVGLAHQLLRFPLGDLTLYLPKLKQMF
jgi:hypothetical protein